MSLIRAAINAKLNFLAIFFYVTPENYFIKLVMSANKILIRQNHIRCSDPKVSN